MKKLLSLLLIATSFIAYSQAPQKMSYQAAIYNSSNTPVTNSPVGMRISILQGGPTGTVVYAETHAVNSNANGLVSLDIGGGTVVAGTFSAIGWANGPFFIKTETDPAGGTNYSIVGTSQLLSVPYALYAQTSGSSFTPGAGININAGVISVTNTPLAYSSVGGTTAFNYNSSNTAWTQLADLTTTITLANPASVYISYQVGSTSINTSTGNFTCRLMINGVEEKSFRHTTSVVSNMPSVFVSNASNIVNMPSGVNIITVEYEGAINYANQPSASNGAFTRNLTVKEMR